MKAVLAAAAAAAVQADGQTAHWLHGAPTMTAVSACTCASLNQRSNPLLPTCHFLQLCVDAPKEGPEGSMRGGGLFLEQHTWTPHGPLHHSLALAGLLLPLPAPELPLPQQPLMVAEQPLSRGMGL